MLPLVGVVFTLTVVLVIAALTIVLCKRRKQRVVTKSQHEIVDHIYDVPGVVVKSKSQHEHRHELEPEERETNAPAFSLQMNMESNVAYGCIGPGWQRPTHDPPSEAQSSEEGML